MKRFSNLVEDKAAYYRLIARCLDARTTDQNKGARLIVAGTAADVSLAFEETDSEMLQIAGICQDTEVDADLNPGKAVFRRSQLLDAVRCQAGLKPILMTLSEKNQLLVGNAYMRQMARKMDPANPSLGVRKVIQLMEAGDAGVNLGQILGIDIDSLLPGTTRSLTVAVNRLLN